jgi:hypothetical protein
VPQEVMLKVVPKGLGSRKLEARSRHLFNNLAQNDGLRIEKAGIGLADYPTVSLDEFRKSDKLAEKGR